jgi:hypothetical protein
MFLRKDTFRVLVAVPLFTLILQGNAGGQKDAQKPLLQGLVTMGGLGPLLAKGGHADNTLKEANAHPGVYTGVLLLVSWDELEHVEGKLDVSRIESGLDAVRAYNRKYPETPVRAKLRIFSGRNTPDWVIAKSGGSVIIEDTKQQDIAIGRFWTPAYRNSWKELQRLLAARYDAEPLLAEVAVSSCATMTAEPFIMTLTPENLPKLHAAGFSDEGFKGCLIGALDDYSAWKRTNVDYTVNPFRNTDSGKAQPDEAFTNRVMEAFRRRFEVRGIIANHGLQAEISERQAGVYAELKKLGPPIEFQTISPVLDWDAAFKIGMEHRMTELEVWNTKDAGGPANVTYDQLKRWSTEMKSPQAK